MPNRCEDVVRARRARLFLPMLLLAIGGAACSLLLDLEPDCDRASDCTPYVCNPENTACLASCDRWEDCAPGHLCQASSSTCISQGCVQAGSLAELISVESTSLQYDVAWSGGSYWLIVSTPEQVGILEVTADGGVAAGQSGVNVLEDGLPSTAHPRAVASEDGVHFFWLSTLGDQRRVIRHHAVSPEGVEVGPVDVYQAEAGQSIDLLSAGRFPANLALAWTTVDRRSQIQLLVLNLDGTYGETSVVTAPTEAAMLIGDESTGASQPALASTARRPGYARRVIRSGTSTIEASFFNSQFEAITTHRVSDEEVSSVEDLVAAGMEEEMAVAWIEVRQGVREIMRSVDAELAPVRMAWSSNDGTANPRDMHMTGKSDEFALIWVGEVYDVNDLYFSRFSANGERMYATFPLTHGTATEPHEPHAVAIEDGYGLFWIETADTRSVLHFMKMECGP